MRESCRQFSVREGAAESAEATESPQGQDRESMRDGEELQAQAGVDSVANRDGDGQKNAGDKTDFRSRMRSGKRGVHGGSWLHPLLRGDKGTFAVFRKKE